MTGMRASAMTPDFLSNIALGIGRTDIVEAPVKLPAKAAGDDFFQDSEAAE